MALGKWADDKEKNGPKLDAAHNKAQVDGSFKRIAAAFKAAQDVFATGTEDDGDWGTHGKGSTQMKSHVSNARGAFSNIKKFGSAADVSKAEDALEKVEVLAVKYDAKLNKERIRKEQADAEAPRLKAEGRDKDKFTKFGSF